jgi:hypothetical protein
MIHELRTYTIKTEYGGVRELERRFGNGIDVRLKYSALGGFFHTLSGNMSQVVHIWPYKDLRDRAESRAAANRDESNRWPPGIAELFERQEVEILIPAPFMPELAPRTAGRLWELRWQDYKPVETAGALEAYRDALPAFEKHAPVVGVWTVDVGPSLGRIYTLTAYRDHAHLEQAQDAIAGEDLGPMPAPVARGLKLLEPSHFSTLQ